MFDRRDGFLVDLPGAALAASLFALALPPHSAGAQHLEAPTISGSVIFMGPLGADRPADFVGRMTIEPSARAMAPWVNAGLRWNGPLEQAPHAVGGFGVRFRHRSVRLGVGLSRDVAYKSVSTGGSRDSVGEATSLTSTELQNGPGGRRLVPTRTGYTMRPVADVVTSIGWSASRLAVGVETGRRLTGPAHRRHWFGATVATPLLQRFALVAAVVQRHDFDVSRGGMQLKLGVAWGSAPWSRRAPPPPAPSVSPMPPSPRRETVFSVRHVPNGIQLRFHAPAARAVEVRSDLTAWMPAPLLPAADGFWQAELVAPPGIHRLAIRVDDGDWLPPPGLPIGSDGYGSAVGLVIVDR